MKIVRSERSAVLLALASVLCWSGAATAFKMALMHGSPWLVVFWGSVTSSAIFVTAVMVRRHRITGSDLLSGLYLGFLNPFLYYLVLLNAYNGLPAQIAMVVNYLWPVVLVLLSVPLLGQKLKLKGFFGILLSFAGVVFLALAGWNANKISIISLILALISTVIWAVYWILNTKNKGKTTAVLCTSFVAGSFYLLVYGFITGQDFFLDVKALPWILYIGVLEMGLTYIMWNTALKWASSTAKVSGLIFLTPFLALVVIGIVVGEKIATSTVAGLMLVIGGILIEKRSTRKDFVKNRLPADRR